MLGYDNSSIKTGNELNGEHYVGGSLSVTKKLADEKRDDQKVRTVAVSDGRGITIFSSIDTFGLPNNEVRIIREKFQAYADEKGYNITSVNISALHQHSCIDTFGLNGDLVDALFFSSIRNILGLELPGGQNDEFMENLYKVTVDSMIKAVKNMEKLIEMLEETLPEGIPHVFISSVTGLGVSVLKDILWNELNKENIQTELSKESLVHRAKDMNKLQDELRAMGQDDDITVEYEDIDEMEDFEYEFDDDFELDGEED